MQKCRTTCSTDQQALQRQPAVSKASVLDCQAMAAALKGDRTQDARSLSSLIRNGCMAKAHMPRSGQQCRFAFAGALQATVRTGIAFEVAADQTPGVLD